MIDADLSMGEFEEIAKRAYVTVASGRAARSNGSVNLSRVAAVTGLSRAEVKALFAGAKNLPQQPPRSRAGRVIDGWTTDPKFRTSIGAPRPLALAAGPSSFVELVRRYAGDIPPKAILDRLERLQLVKVMPTRSKGSKRVHLVKKAPTTRLNSHLLPIVEHLADALCATGPNNSTTLSAVRLKARDQPQLAAIVRAAIERRDVFLSGLESSFQSTSEKGPELEIFVGVSQLGKPISPESGAQIPRTRAEEKPRT